MVSLPTGAGKTRVAVEAAVSFVLNTPNNSKPVLWIAQTDELCEQAAQSFRHIWSKKGLEYTDLKVVRFWRGNPDPVPSNDSSPSAIITSIQTLTSRLSLNRLSLLKNSALVIIDEAHHALAKTYRRFIEWLAENDSHVRRSEVPIIGLSATPFRGNSEEHTWALARIFDNNILPAEQRLLYKKLIEDGILSNVETEEIKSDRHKLTKEESEHFGRFRVMSRSVLDRLSKDQLRNYKIVKRVCDLTNEGPVLLFANSVSHSKFLAARLCVEGINAASVHGGTEAARRQHFIREFQEGNIKVLVNYQVLSTGFDAPKTSAILISRPVFSPVRFMQMIGRGLRGVKNGGTETCKIITLIDNLLEHECKTELAYRRFIKYYKAI